MPLKSDTSDPEASRPSALSRLLTSIVSLLSSIISGGAVRVTPSPALPSPERFSIGDDFDRWEAQTKLYLRQFPVELHKATVLGLLNGSAFDLAYEQDLMDPFQGDFFPRLRNLLTRPCHPLEYARQFHSRVQGPAERFVDFVHHLRRLGRMAFPEEPLQQLERRVLQQAVEGVTNVKLKEKFYDRFPESLTIALDIAQRVEMLNDSIRNGDADRCFAVNGHHEAAGGRQLQPRGDQSHGTMAESPKFDCYLCKKYGDAAYSCGHNRQSKSFRNGIDIMSHWWNSRNASHLPIIVGQLNNQQTTLMVDTGAACSLISSDLLSPKQRACLSPSRRLVAANGNSIPTLGELDVRLKVENFTCKHRMVVCLRIPWGGILGIDFLRRFKCTVDLGNPTLHLSNNIIPLGAPPSIEGCFAVAVPVTSVEKQIDQMLGNVPTHLSKEETARSRNLIWRYAHAFAWSGAELGRTNVLRHEIDTGETAPIRQPPRRVPVHLRMTLESLIEDMLGKGVIRPSTSPWASPVVLVSKKDGSMRLCVDYRRLNSATKRDSFPLPRIDDTLDALNGSQWFSTLDLASGYWQVEVHPSSRAKTAFTVPSGLYEFETMPFGLANAPATFQRLMQTVLRGITPSRCLVYLDDVIVHGRTLNEHMENLELVLQRLSEAGLKLKPAKCCLFKTSISFLGHVVSREGISTDQAKIAEVQNWPQPQSAEEVRSFLGLASYYRRFVPSFAHVASPLHKLCAKDAQFHWDKVCDHAFQQLKLALCSPPTLAFPDVSMHAEPFILDTDASDLAIGGVLSQRDQEGRERVIAYASRCLNARERNYCTTRKEMLALVAFIRHFRHFLLGRHFVVRTDHHSLKWLQEFRNPEGQLARWQEELQEYDFECIHRPGKQHKNADALSRRPPRHANCPSCCKTLISVVNLADNDSSVWTEEQQRDPELSLIYQRLSNPSDESQSDKLTGVSWETKCLQSAMSHLKILDGILYFQYSPNYPVRIVVPQSLVSRVLDQLHAELGHAGQYKMDQAARQRFWWPNQRRDIVNFCRSCKDCGELKDPRQRLRAPLQNISAGFPNECLGIDLIGPLPTTPRENRYILVMVDYFTKWCEAAPLKRTDAHTVARVIFDTWISRWGAPIQLHSDRGSNFESLIVSEMCSILKIRKTRTTPYHPEGNGLVERTNRSLRSLLRAFVDRFHTDDWDLALPHCLLAYRGSVHASTGQTPHFLMTGRELRLPIDLTTPTLAQDQLLSTTYVQDLRKRLIHSHQLARQSLQAAQRHQKEYYDRRAHTSPIQPGDYVWLHSGAPTPGLAMKFQRKWKGPFKVLRLLTDTTCLITPEGGTEDQAFTVHYNRLKPADYLPNADSTPPPAALEVEVSTTNGTFPEDAHHAEDSACFVGESSCNEHETSSSIIACFYIVGGGGRAARGSRIWRAQDRWRDQDRKS